MHTVVEESMPESNYVFFAHRNVTVGSLVFSNLFSF